jgi:hypothetical protein
MNLGLNTTIILITKKKLKSLLKQLKKLGVQLPDEIVKDDGA